MISSNLSWTGKRCLAACCSQEPTAGMNHLLPDTSAQTQTPVELRPHAESSASAPRRDPNPELFVELHAESLLVAGTKAAGREPGGGRGGALPCFLPAPRLVWKRRCSSEHKGSIHRRCAARPPPLPRPSPPTEQLGCRSALGSGKAACKRSSWRLLGWDVARLRPARCPWLCSAQGWSWSCFSFVQISPPPPPSLCSELGWRETGSILHN